MAVTIKTKQVEVAPMYSFYGQSFNSWAIPDKDSLGGKGAGLASMFEIGLPIPPGFTITCPESIRYLSMADQAKRDKFVAALVKKAMMHVEGISNVFGYTPLFSVRSGARVSMPGMMDTILNVGLTPENMEEWKDRIGERAALDSLRRLLQMYGSVAMGAPMEGFVLMLGKVKEDQGVTLDSELDVQHLATLVSAFEQTLEASGIGSVPTTLEGQLAGAITAVFESWNNPRAKEYRAIHGYSDDWGTAVTIQAMVFGNMNDQSATGVLFTRDPSTGAAGITGEYLVNAQGEDVVAGIRTPDSIAGLQKAWKGSGEIYHDLMVQAHKLESYYRDMQDIEFTIENGKLYILQTRSGKRTAAAAFKIAHAMVQEGMLSEEQALSRVTSEQAITLTQDVIDPSFTTPPMFTGIAAGGGLVSGVVAMSSEAAINCNVPCILVRKETDPDDIGGMHAAVGILTSTGGMTSHAAVVARGMDKSCVVGATGMHVMGNGFTFNGHYVAEGDTITIDGSTGGVWAVVVPVIPGGLTEDAEAVLSWVGVGTQRITPHDWSEEALGKAILRPLASELYIDTLTMADAKNDMGALLHILITGYTKAIIDLTHSVPDDFACHMFGEMFGVGTPYVTSDKKVEAILADDGWDSVKGFVRFNTDTKQLAGMLTLAGYKVASGEVQVHTVADLLNATSKVLVSEATVASVFGGVEAYNTLLDMVESVNGVDLSSPMEVPRYWYEFLDKAG